MAIKIDSDKCTGCTGRKEGLCEKICPGNLIRRSNGKAEIEHPEECWDCTACVKACSLNAINLYLPEEIGGKGSLLTVQTRDDEIIWIFKGHKGKNKQYKVNR